MKQVLSKLTLIIIMTLFFAHTLKADDLMLEKFDVQPEKRWEFFSDQVMGGISTGKISFNNENQLNYINLTGNVSTQNQGGFIQARIKLIQPLTKNIEGIVLNAKGNNTVYYLHLRTRGTILPWQYYQAKFSVTSDWKEIKIPLKTFKRSGSFLRKNINPSSLKSIGLVAYGRDHKADLSVASVNFY